MIPAEKIPEKILEKISIQELYKREEKEFTEWLKKRMETWDALISGFENHILPAKPIYEPKEALELVEGKPKTVPRAIRNLLTYLEEKYYMTELNGFSFELWRKFLPYPETEPLGEVISAEEIKEAFEQVKERWKKDRNLEFLLTLMRCLAYSGARADHIYNMLTTLDRRKFEKHGKVWAYPLVEFIKGRKEGYYCYLPEKFAEKLERFDVDIAYKTALKKIAPSQWKGKFKVEESRVNSEAIRKWFINFAAKQRVHPDVIDFMVGHKMAKVGTAHYFDMHARALDEYQKLLNKFPI